jgi:hypothetical protein
MIRYHDFPELFNQKRNLFHNNLLINVLDRHWRHSKDKKTVKNFWTWICLRQRNGMQIRRIERKEECCTSLTGLSLPSVLLLSIFLTTSIPLITWAEKKRVTVGIRSWECCESRTFYICPCLVHKITNVHGTRYINSYTKHSAFCSPTGTFYDRGFLQIHPDTKPVVWIRIRIHFGPLDPDPRGPEWPTKVKKSQILMC